jgi:hypothetical protein
MTEISRNEHVVYRVVDRVDRVSSNMAKKSKIQKPFDKPMPDPREELYHWETTSIEVKEQFMQRHPLEYAKRSLEMDALRRRYGR